MSFIKTINNPSNIEWSIFEDYKFSEEDKNSISEDAMQHSVERKYENKIDKYNKNLTETELSYITKIKEHTINTKDKLKRVLGEAEKEAQNRYNSLENDTEFNPNLLLDKTINSINTKEVEFKTNIDSIADPLIRARRNLRLFRIKNDLLDRDAEYQKSNILFIGTLLIFLIVETIANAYFYAQGNDLGLLGGAFQAFFVSAANVIISFVIGYVLLRYLNYKSIFKKILSLLGLIIAIPLLGFLHLVAAHYRELLSKNIENINIEVLKQTWNNPFDINNLDSLILIIIGVGISFFVIWKAYRVNDPYPGYAKKWKIWEESEATIDKYIKEHKESLNSEFTIFQDNINILNNNIKYSKDMFNELLTNIKSFKKTVDRYIDNAINETLKIVREYRNSYNKVAEANILLVDENIKKHIENELEVAELEKMTENTITKLESIYKNFNNFANQAKANVERSKKEIKEIISEKSKESKIKEAIVNTLEEAEKNNNSIGGDLTKTDLIKEKND